MIRLMAALVFAVVFSRSSTAAVQWTLTTADFHTQAITLKSIDAAGVHVAPATGGDDTVIPFARFLDLNRSMIGGQISGKFVLHLASGDAIGGYPDGVKVNKLAWSSPAIAGFLVPMKEVVAVTRPGAQVPDSRHREDVVTLSNGDTVRGIVSNFNTTQVTVQADAGNTDLPLASVREINFAATAGNVVAAEGFRVRFDDGSSVIADSLNISADKVVLTIRKEAMPPIDLAKITMIEQVNGPVSWLSSRPTLESVYIPFFGTPKTNAAKMDRNWTGQDPVRFGSQEFAHGIGVHSYSRLSWALDGTYEAVRTRYAIDTKDANTQADVTIRILLDGKAVYEQTHVRTGTLSPVVAESLAGAKKLTLEVDYGDNLDTQDRVNWIEPALLKKKPE